MATKHTLTITNLPNIAGVPYVKNMRPYVVTNLPAGEALIDTTTNDIMLGGQPIKLFNGSGSVSLPATDAIDLNVVANTVQYEVRAEYADPATRDRKTWRSGYFPLTGPANLADVATDASPMAVESASQFAQEAKDARDGAVAIAGPVDATVAGLVTNTGGVGPLTRAALSATIAARAADRSGVRFIPAGDSLSTYLNGGTAAFNDAIPAWPVATQAYTNGRLQLVRSGGVSGNLSAQLLARLQVDVIDHDPSLVAVWIGTNDVSSAVADATFYANVTAIHDALRAAGIESVVVTIPPRTDTTKHATIAKWNAWLKRFASETRRPLWDFHAVLVNPADGTYKSGYSDDGIHATSTGHHALATYAAARVNELVVPGSPLRSTYNTDPRSLVLNGFLITGSPTNWTAAGSIGSGFTESLVTDADFAGRAFEWVWTTGDGFRQLQADAITTGYSVGDVLRFHARIKVTAAANLDQGEGVYLNVVFDGATPPANSQKVVWGVRDPGASGLFYADLTVPPGTTGIYFSANASANSGETFTARVGEFGVINLTTAP